MYPILMPGVIFPATRIQNALTDHKVRHLETIKSIDHLVASKVFKKIVVVDGSGVEVLSKKSIDNYNRLGVEVEQLSFLQNQADVMRFGKSNGECQIVEYAINNSKFIGDSGGFYKLSPRYMFHNVEKVVGKMDQPNIFFQYNPNGLFFLNPFMMTIFYKTSIEFYKENLAICIKECTHSQEGFLESLFYTKLLAMKKGRMYLPFPKFHGIAGTTGKEIANNYYLARNCFSHLGRLAFSYD